MRLLIISNSYYPLISPRAFRWTAIAELWAKQRMGVDVVCAYPESDVQQFEKINGVNIHRVHDPSQRLRPSTDQNVSLSNLPLDISKKIREISKYLVISLRWPDRDWLWVPKAYLYTKNLLKSHKYDYIITVSHPFSSHLIGQRIKKLSPKIKWLVDIGDPFSFAVEMPLNNFRLYRKLNYLSEKAVFKQADSIVVTNKRTAERYIELFGQENISKIHVIGPLVEIDPIDDMHLNCSAKQSGEISIMFAGNLINPVRRPGVFLSWAIDLLDAWKGQNQKLHFDLFGDSLADLQKYLPENKMFEGIRIHGRIPKAEIPSAMRQADILVNCGNITDYQLPSKIYEYMATGKPIINFVLNPKDTSLPAMKDYPSVLNVISGETDIHSVVQFIESCNQLSFSDNRNQVIDILKSHTVSSIADRYLEILR